MSDPSLVRVTTHPYERLIVCHEHLRVVAPHAAYDEIPATQVSFWGHQCLMCGFDSVPGRICENADCKKPLHPQWPAIYCCNLCALEDS